MNHRPLRLAAWPSLTIIVCTALVMGCVDGSGPSSLTSPEGKPAYEGAKPPPPPPPPPPADPAIAFVANGRVHGNAVRFLKVMNADGSNLTTIYTHTSSAVFMHPSWSPGGNHIAAAPAFNLWRIDVSVVNGVPTGSTPTVLLDRTTTLGAPTWSPQGNLIAFHDVDLKTIETMPAGGGIPTVQYTSESPYTFIPSLAWNHDATQIAFTEGGAIRVLTPLCANIDETPSLQEFSVG